MRAAVYLRQSLDQDGRGVAVARQREDCLELCRTKGWDPVEYVDNSVSASTRKPRPAYQRMLKDIEAGEIQAVVAWDLDRLHRQPIELEHFIALADQHRLALATATGDVDLSTDNGRLFARIKGAVARAEVERKSVRQKRAGLQRAQDGKPWGPHRPFGFAEDRTSHHETEALALRDAYAWLLAGLSQHQIARDLNALGFTTPRGNPWQQQTVRAVLRNPRNAGLRAYKGEVVGKADWEPIVPEETYRAAVGRMSAQAAPGTGRRKWLLSGVAKCGVCGAACVTAYIPPRKGESANVRTYACVSGKHVARNAEYVDQFVSMYVLEILSRSRLAELAADRETPGYGELSSRADELRQRLDSLAIEFADGDLTLSQLRTATERIQSRIADLETRMSRSSITAVLAPFQGTSNAEATWESLSIARRRGIVEALLTVRIDPVAPGRRREFDPEAIVIGPKTD